MIVVGFVLNSEVKLRSLAADWSGGRRRSFGAKTRVESVSLIFKLLFVRGLSVIGPFEGLYFPTKTHKYGKFPTDPFRVFCLPEAHPQVSEGIW